ncbi:MAG: acyl-ACP--UDP-N-acetylglucosamine O-acyltransferase [Deltaproteobacteria bacterium]|nr:acyl-ACP--UDP-N-acetylglucosamine O-acyltransferase [Deltaproteobacteria bacterium]MBW1952511.1 acyl-ACP--UDP-N-acetylglucosamine O-acyltransferase [Deltaproteobacteria bacterium]MBW1987272.1 acyl-ACP--UDP-N-acetylglucosamine O-acyltransferase [Deltaproteobacteria bacterium]MBW2135130.1 acyl-ACP--UDP-N-acetylglucosamine O-acyltransferase [Deltaproteobacteria bacterium]
MPHIHPTALVDSKAELADSVTVGPYSIIAGRVIIGADTQIGPHVVIKDFTTIGARVCIYQFASIGEIPQDLKFRGEESSLLIGDDNVIREFTTLHRGTANGGGVTRIGNGNLLMAYTHVAHDCQVGNGVIMSNAATLAGHITVEDHAILGGLSAVHQFCKIGAHAFIGGCSAVARDVPPYCMAVGNRAKLVGLNLVGLKRAGYDSAFLEVLKTAYNLLFLSELNMKEAMARVRQELPDLPEIQNLLCFIETSERGLAPVDVRENRSHRG